MSTNVFMIRVATTQHGLGGAGIPVFAPENADTKVRNEALRARKEDPAINEKDEKQRFAIAHSRHELLNLS
jgi:hypothetical protein